MIRRDYLLRMIEQCVQALARSRKLTDERQFELARRELDQGIQSLTGLALGDISQLSDTELTAALLQGEPTQFLHQKSMMLIALLHRAGEVDAAEGRAAPARACYLRALNLQLSILAQEGPTEFPDFVPKVEVLAGALVDQPLPTPTAALLMQHYERCGQYGKAEDMLYLIAGAVPPGTDIAAFGIQFYQRLLGQTDQALESGNLPRAEVEAGLAEYTRQYPSSA